MAAIVLAMSPLTVAGGVVTALPATVPVDADSEASVPPSSAPASTEVPESTNPTDDSAPATTDGDASADDSDASETTPAAADTTVADDLLGGGAITPFNLAPGGIAPACSGSTSFIASPNLVLPQILVDAYDAGNIVHVYDNAGFNDGFAPPVCATRNVDGVAVSEWSYCTEQFKNTCMASPGADSDFPWAPIGSHPNLTETQVLQIAALLDSPDESNSYVRAVTQVQVWCISEGRAVGSTPAGYFGYIDQFTSAGDPDDAVCWPRPAVSSAAPTLSVNGPATVPSAGPAAFTLSTNTNGSIDLTASEGTVELCAGDASGALLVGTTLTTPALGSHTVELCIPGPLTGVTVELAASAEASAPNTLRLHWNGDESCQVFLTGRATTVALSDSAAAAVVTEDTTTLAPTTTAAGETTTTAADGTTTVAGDTSTTVVGASTSTTVAGTLPSTGTSATPVVVALALAVLAVGGTLLAITRLRPRSR